MKKKDEFNQLANNLICIAIVLLLPYFTLDSNWVLSKIGSIPLSIGVIIFFIGIGLKFKNFKGKDYSNINKDKHE